MSEYFDKELIDDLVIIIVNKARATSQNADEISKIIKAEIEEERKKIVIDLSQCKFVDSIFLGTLIYSAKELKKNNGQMKIVQPIKLPSELFSISKSLHLLEYYKTREEAIKSFEEDIQPES